MLKIYACQTLHSFSLLNPLVPPCVRTGVFHQKRKAGGAQGSGLTCRRPVPHDWNDEHWREGQSRLAPAQWLIQGGRTEKWPSLKSVDHNVAGNKRYLCSSKVLLEKEPWRRERTWNLHAVGSMEKKIYIECASKITVNQRAFQQMVLGKQYFERLIKAEMPKAST